MAAGNPYEFLRCLPIIEDDFVLVPGERVRELLEVFKLVVAYDKVKDQVIAQVTVPPAGFEPATFALKGRCPWPLDDGGFRTQIMNGAPAPVMRLRNDRDAICLKKWASITKRRKANAAKGRVAPRTLS